MTGLQRGHRLTPILAGAAIAVIALVVVAPPASGGTLGGERLASVTRTAHLGPGAGPLPPVRAATWILADATTGEVLAHKGAHVQRAPASTLKMLTALAVMPQVPPETRYRATARAAGADGSRVGLRVGKAYTMDQLWYAVFLPSANDAAIAVAEANGGVRRTVRQMNALAYELRALDTVARNTSGLDAHGQLSSAYDLALLARAGLTREDFARYAGTATARFPDTKGKGLHRIYTTNRLLLHRWRGAIGVKTGYTSRAGRTYVGAATRDGRTLIVALMGIKESSEEAAKRLLAWGFANADDVTPVGVLVEPGSELPDRTPPASPVVTPVNHAAPATDPELRAQPGGSSPTAAGPIPDAAGLPAIPVAVIAVTTVIAVGITGAALRRRRSSCSARS